MINKLYTMCYVYKKYPQNKHFSNINVRHLPSLVKSKIIKNENRCPSFYLFQNGFFVFALKQWVGIIYDQE